MVPPRVLLASGCYAGRYDPRFLFELQKFWICYLPCCIVLPTVLHRATYRASGFTKKVIPMLIRDKVLF